MTCKSVSTFHGAPLPFLLSALRQLRKAGLHYSWPRDQMRSVYQTPTPQNVPPTDPLRKYYLALGLERDRGALFYLAG